MRLLLVILIFVVGDPSNAAKILGIFNHPGRSHTFLGRVLLKNLAKKGHQVTMISSFPLEEPVKNYRDIPLPELLEDLKRREMMYYVKTKTKELDELRNMSLQHLEGTFLNPNVKKLLKSDEKFDVVVMDMFFNEATLIFGHIFNAPVIYISSFGNNLLMNDVTGNSLPISYVPGAAFLTDDNMAFKYRLGLTLVNLLYYPFKNSRIASQDEMLRRHFKNPPSINKLMENVALILSNSHFSFETARPYTPNIIPVGGMHLEEPEPLQKDIKDYLDSAENGVIFFSLGSQIKLSNMEEDVLTSVVNAFSKLPQKVLLKFESDHLPNVTENIKIVQWASQTGILAHSNVKLFVTHGGMLSLTEAIYYGVPMVCIPFLGDQMTNAAFIKSREIGRYILANDIKSDSFYDIVKDVLTDSRYLENVEFYSSLLKEQPIRPIDNAVFWVEHVAKFKTGKHLRPFSFQLPWYKYYLLDVAAFLSVILIILGLLMFYVLRKVFRLTKYILTLVNTNNQKKSQ